MRPHSRPEDSRSTDPDPDAGPPSGAASRRAFLVRTGALAGAGALGVAGLSAGAAQASTTAAAAPAEPDHDVPDGEPIVAYVSDVATGEITVMSGEHEISVHDPRLARALARKVR